MANRIQVRRDTLANWTSADPILADAEPSYVTDAVDETVRMKFGDGTNVWTALPYWSPGAGGSSAAGTTFSPAGDVAATDVQAAIVELDAEKAPIGHAHAATAITYTPAGNLVATDVAGAINELDGEKSPTTHDHDASYEALGATSTHNAQTTSVHGITDTSTLVTNDHAGLVNIVHRHDADNTMARRTGVANAVWQGSVTPDNYVPATDLLILETDDLEVFKGADTVRNNTATAVDDLDLSVTLKANTRYVIDVFLAIQATQSADARIGFTYPAGADGLILNNVAFGSSQKSGSQDRSANALSEEQRMGTFGTGATDGLVSHLRIVIDVAGTGGAFTVKWSQWLAEANDVTLKKYSHMRAREIVA